MAVTVTWAVGQTSALPRYARGRIPPFSWDPDATMSVMHSHGVGSPIGMKRFCAAHP